MSNSTYFVQGCPTCGRRLQIRIEYLGRKVVCQHCRGLFTACEPNGTRPAEAQFADAILRRADELLEHASDGTIRPWSPRPR